MVGGDEGARDFPLSARVWSPQRLSTSTQRLSLVKVMACKTNGQKTEGTYLQFFCYTALTLQTGKIKLSSIFLHRVKLHTNVKRLCEDTRGMKEHALRILNLRTKRSL